MRNEYVDLIREELGAVGVIPSINESGKHIKIRWHNLQRQARTFVAPKSASDHRALLNVRAELRRILRTDGMVKTPEERVAQQRPSQLTTAMTLPHGDMSLLSRVSKLEDDMKLMNELLIDYMSQTQRTAQSGNHYDVLKKPLTLPARVYAALDFQSKPLDAIQRAVGDIRRSLLSVTLTQLKHEGLAQNLGRGYWKKLPHPSQKVTS